MQVKRRTTIEKNFLEYAGNKKKLWRLIRQQGGSTKNNLTRINELKYKGTKATSDGDIANVLNNDYIEMAEDLIRDINTLNHEDNSSTNATFEENTIYLKPVTVVEISDIIRNLKNNKKTNDKFSIKAFKLIGPVIVQMLVLIINKSIDTGIVSEAYKKSIIIPIFKKVSKESPENYRPISLIPVCSKILEISIYKRCMEFVNKHNIIQHIQFGFRKNHSTIHAICNFVNRLYKINESANNHAIGVFIDFSKAFNTINHNILMQKLYKYGLRGKIADWLSSYLKDRKQKVTYNGALSDEKVINIGSWTRYHLITFAIFIICQ